MATNFPTSLDNLTNPTSGSALNSPDHAGQHADANDAIEALEAKVGVNGSAVTTSLDYKVTASKAVTDVVDPTGATSNQVLKHNGTKFVAGSVGAGELSGTTLASGVTSSSLTSLGVLTGLNMATGTANLANIDAVGTITAHASSSQDGVKLQGRAGGSSSANVTLTPTTLTGNRTLTLPDASGTVATTANVGMRYVTSGTFSSASSVSINNCFSSTYTNYRVVFGNITQSTTLVLRIRMRLSGTDSTAASWDYAFPYLYVNGASISINNGTAQTGLYVGDTNSTANSTAAFSFDVFQPNVARRTVWLGQAINIYSSFFTMSGGGTHNVETAYDGFTLYTSTGTITGNYQVYGYTI